MATAKKKTAAKAPATPKKKAAKKAASAKAPAAVKKVAKRKAKPKPGTKREPWHNYKSANWAMNAKK